MTGRRMFLSVFVATEAALYIAFLACDIRGGASGISTALKYASMLLCLFASLSGITKKDGRYVASALALTVCADLFLLVLDNFYAIGVAFFCPVQIIYALRLRRMREGKTLFALRALLFAAMLAIVCAVQPSALNILSAFYFSQLVCNAIEAADAKNRLFSVGLLLFVCCDICVGLCNITFPFPASDAVFPIIRILMWAFYLPSQVLIVLSSQRRSL